MAEYPQKPKTVQPFFNTWLLISVYFSIGFALFLGELAFYGWSLFVVFPLNVGLAAGLMPPLDTDKPFFLSLGLPVPQKCILESDTVGAKRVCYFEGGTIEEEVTDLKRGELLKMKVTKYTLPGLKWLKFKDAVYYFRPESNGTLITRVTTYYSSLKPRFYWRWCERSAIEAEHEYVLRNLKKDLDHKY